MGSISVSAKSCKVPLTFRTKHTKHTTQIANKMYNLHVYIITRYKIYSVIYIYVIPNELMNFIVEYDELTIN